MRVVPLSGNGSVHTWWFISWPTCFEGAREIRICNGGAMLPALRGRRFCPNLCAFLVWQPTLFAEGTLFTCPLMIHSNCLPGLFSPPPGLFLASSMFMYIQSFRSEFILLSRHKLSIDLFAVWFEKTTRLTPMDGYVCCVRIMHEKGHPVNEPRVTVVEKADNH